ncbi:MAG: hypothetical protein HZB41_09935 [Ignavibacteriae bacterium]|nr:hypothetical protein [Ignavibacteriota bacterium]
MKFKYICFIIFILFFVYSTEAETIFRNSNSLFIKLYGGSSSASSYNDINETVINFLTDEKGSHSVKDYTMEITKKSIGLNCEYSPSDNIILYCDIPLTFNELNEVYKLDTTYYVRFNRANYYLTHMEYVGLGAKYLLFSRKSYGFLIFETRIPPGFKRGIIDTSKSAFLSDGAFEILSGLGFGFKSDKFLLESTLLYNFRDEELVDQFIIKLEAGLSTQKDSRLVFIGQVVQSLSSFKNVIPLIVNQTVLQEDYFSLGFEFSMFFSDSYYGEFNYNLRFFGKNSWNFGIYRFTAGFLF